MDATIEEGDGNEASGVDVDGEDGATEVAEDLEDQRQDRDEPLIDSREYMENFTRDIYDIERQEEVLTED